MCKTVLAWFTPSFMDCRVRSQVIAFWLALSLYSVSCTSLAKNPAILKWSSTILTVMHMYMWKTNIYESFPRDTIHSKYSISIIDVFLHFTKPTKPQHVAWITPPFLSFKNHISIGSIRFSPRLHHALSTWGQFMDKVMMITHDSTSGTSGKLQNDPAEGGHGDRIAHVLLKSLRSTVSRLIDGHSCGYSLRQFHWNYFMGFMGVSEKMEE